MLGFKTTEVAEWWDVFHALPKQGLLPDRVALNPGEIKPLLPNMMIFDLSEPPVVRYRLVGTEIVDRYGFDPTGQDFTDFLPAETREQSRIMLFGAVRHPFGVYSVLRSRHGAALTAEIETLSFPFASGDRPVTQLVTVSQRVTASERLRDDSAALDQVEAAGVKLIDMGAGLPEGAPVV